MNRREIQSKAQTYDMSNNNEYTRYSLTMAIDHARSFR